MIKIDKITRSDRKTLAIQINTAAEVIVKAPKSMSDSVLRQTIEDKSAWIQAKQAEMLKREKFVRTYEDGDTLPMLGKNYELKFVDGFQFALQQKGEVISVASDLRAHIREFMEKWYQKKAKFFLVPRVYEIASGLGITVKSVQITSAKRRWGSCTSRGSINLAWRLVMAPEHIADYVIYHELAHRYEMNHSKKFWNIVADMCPNYNECRLWLKENGKYLDI